MEKQKLTIEQVLAMDLPNIILYAAPVMIGLVIIEWVVSFYKKRNYYDGKDTLAATAIGLTNVAISAGIKLITIGLILFFYILFLVFFSI